MASFTCRQCGSRLSVSDDHFGKARCPKCQRVAFVCGTGATATPAAPVAAASPQPPQPRRRWGYLWFIAGAAAASLAFLLPHLRSSPPAPPADVAAVSPVEPSPPAPVSAALAQPSTAPTRVAVARVAPQITPEEPNVIRSLPDLAGPSPRLLPELPGTGHLATLPNAKAGRLSHPEALPVSGPAPAVASIPQVPPLPPPKTQDEIYGLCGPFAGRISGVGDDHFFHGGSGFFVAGSRNFVTCYHVLQGCWTAAIRMPDGKVLRVTGVVAVDRKADLLVLAVDDPPAGGLVVTAGAPSDASRLFVISSPGKEFNKVTAGVLTRSFDEGGVKFREITAAIDHGSSGGCVLDSLGQVIGVAWGEGTADGLPANFAVHSREVRRLLDSAGPPQPLKDSVAPAQEPSPMPRLPVDAR